MAKQTLNILKNCFRTGLKPTQQQFWDWMDSFFHKDEKIPLTSIDGIQEEFDKKADKGLIQISDVENLEETLDALSTGGADLTGYMKEADYVGETANKTVNSAENAFRALNDVDDNEITITYATKVELGTKVDKNGTDRLITQTEAAKLAGINEHWRGSYQTLTALKTAVPVANPGDEATIDAGVGTQAQKAIWDETDQDWYISSGTPVTVDQAINEGSINAVAGGAVFNALENKVDKVAGKGLSTNDLTDELIAEFESEKVGITKQGFNGELSPVVYPVDRQRTVIGYKLGSNATDFSVTINSVNYTKADVTNVVVPVNTEITINDVTILTGNDTGNVVLILK